MEKKRFYPRTTRPKNGEYYLYLYNNKNNGGLSKCINGKPMDAVANVLANCVGYGCGRFNEVYNQATESTGIKYPWINCNAKNIPSVAKLHGFKTGDIPQYGAMLVWQGGNSNCGHVVVVEEIYSQTSIRTSDSGYGNFTFQMSRRAKSYGNGWSTNLKYKNPTFVYNPAYYDNKYDVPSDTLYKGCKKGSTVKWLQLELNKNGFNLDVDGSFGAKTENALMVYQQMHNLTVDGRCGAKTKLTLLNSNIEVVQA